MAVPWTRHGIVLQTFYRMIIRSSSTPPLLRVRGKGRPAAGCTDTTTTNCSELLARSTAPLNLRSTQEYEFRPS